MPVAILFAMSLQSSIVCLLLLTSVSLRGFAQESEGTQLRDRYKGEKNGPQGKCSTEWTTLNGGLHYRAIRCLGSSDLDVHVVKVDPDRWELDTALVDGGSARSVARARKAPFAINANFFDTDRKAMGLVVRSGEQVKSPRSTSWQSIFLIRKDGTARIVLPKSWPAEKSKAWMAVQAGPRLVVEGHAARVKQSYAASRSGVCIQKDNRILFFATPADRKFDMYEIVRIARRDEADGGLACQEAMLFDGGHSTQLFLDTDKKSVSVTGDPVPVFIHASAK